MSQQSVRQSARRSALDAQAVLRRQLGRPGTPALGSGDRCSDRTREREGAVRDAERRAGQALQTMTEDEGSRSATLPTGANWRP